MQKSDCIIGVEHVSKFFGDKAVLNDVNLSVRKGEFVTILGPSGCGKTTLLRLIAGFQTASEGVITIAGKDITQTPPHKRPVNTVFQKYALFPHLNVFNNIAFGLKLKKLPGATIEKKVKQALRMVGMTDYEDRDVDSLSGGQQQRVAIARAMVRRPGVFLMDEPLSNLDARLRTHMRGKIAELHQRLGATFIYVTHDQSEAMTLSDRIALMMEGEIIQLGTPDELYERPDNIRVAKFIGSPEINLLPALVRSGRLIFNGQATALRIASPDSTVTIGIRAQRVHTADVDADGPLIQLTVHREETLGEDVLLYGETAVDGRSYPFVARASAKQTYQLRKESSSWNKPILLEAASSGVLVFDEQGERIVSRLNGMQEAA